MIKKSQKKKKPKKLDISWFLQATKLQATLANSCTVSTLAQQMEIFSGSAFVLVRHNVNTKCLSASLPTHLQIWVTIGFWPFGPGFATKAKHGGGWAGRDISQGPSWKQSIQEPLKEVIRSHAL